MAPSFYYDTYNTNDTLPLPIYSFPSHQPPISIFHSSSRSHSRPHPESLVRPHTSSSHQHSFPGRPRHKNMREIIGPTTEDEFDALPIAVRRKYFSTLERLRFARDSPSIDLDESAISPVRRRQPPVDRGTSRYPLTFSHSRQSSANGRLRKTTRPRGRSSVSSTDVSWFLTLPEKLRKKQSAGISQADFSGRRRNSVILDAADEAIYKASRRASRNLNTMMVSPTVASSTESMDWVQDSGKSSRPSSLSKAMYESFRWMDEEKDLDLRLVFDDYHANLDGVVLPTPESTRRPSFRRHMSISRIPFGRTSFSALNQVAPPVAIQQTHTRQKSRTLSLMQPKHAATESISSIDPSATHYQDPEARLKLRVYLASPQKFDEAIEFGFPSKDGISTLPDKENKNPPKVSRDKSLSKSSLAENSQTFLDDDTVSLSDDATMLDPDSPLTPSDPFVTFRNQPPRHRPHPKVGRASEDLSQMANKKPLMHKHTESYAHSLAGSREMTLRMTLTRPDLRADESMLYGWQAVRNRSPLGEDTQGRRESCSVGKTDLKGPFGGDDGWGSAEKDSGVVKRFWNRVKTSQRRVS